MRAIFSFLLLVFAASALLAQNNNDKAPKLFRIKATSQRLTNAAAADRPDRGKKREMEIEFDPSAISQISSAKTIELPLFDGKSVFVDNLTVENRGKNDKTLRGHVNVNNFSGDVILTFKSGFVSGLIYSSDGVYEVVPRADGQLLVELDQSAFPECAGDIRLESAPATRQVPALVADTAAAADSGDRIDVLVVITPASKLLLGGDAQARVFAQQAIDSTNTAYINSLIRQRLRLVGVEDYTYVETASPNTDLTILRADTAVGALRDRYQADLVSMIGEMQGVCGIGYLMDQGDPTTGFTATARSCAVGNLSFAHELGHNMGGQHNPENGTNSAYPFGFGHYMDGVFRTVMSYSNPCPSGCTRVPYFSNPSVLYSGSPTGIDNARDNARLIELTADAIANYRYSGSSISLTNYNGAEQFSRLIARDVRWSSNNLGGNVRIEVSRDEGTTWKTLIADTPNDGSERILLGGVPTRRARMRVVSVTDGAVSDSSTANFSIR